MDENKNQNEEYDFDNDFDNDQDHSVSVPSWMTGSSDYDNDDEDEEDKDVMGHESLVDDQDVDIQEYEEEERTPFDNDDNDEIADDEEDEDDDEEDNDNVVMAKSKIILIKKLLSNIKENTDKLNNLLGGLVTSEDEERINIVETTEGVIGTNEDNASKIVEGVFDGENMIGPDGKQYSVPSNYASKSKLVEGDLLKLTITQKGTFVYKQIKPIERDRVIGTLEKLIDGSYMVSSGSKKWRILTASVTYFKGESGDEAVILVPKAGESKWAAVENIIKGK